MPRPVEGFTPRYEVVAPTATPRPFGLLSLAVEAPGGAPDLAYRQGVRYWSEMCDLDTQSLEGYCPDGTKDITPYKPVPVEGAPFLITSGVVCTAPGFDARERAIAHLSRGEQYRAEDVFWQAQLDRDDRVNLGESASPDCALGKLEAHAANTYAGSPVLHVPVRYLPVLAKQNLLVRSGSRLETPWGTRIVAGSGYPAATTAETITLLLTGEVGIWRTEVIANDDFDTQTNERSAIAERLYVMTADCLAATITVPVCSGGIPCPPA